MKYPALLAPFLAAPALAFAAIDLDKPLKCDMSASTFFRPLVQYRAINLEPVLIEDSISHFRPTTPLGSGGMLAFGMKVDTVIGYARGQILFRRGPGTEPTDTYGVIVKEGIGNVQAQLQSMGAFRAQTRRISSTRTAIICEGI